MATHVRDLEALLWFEDLYEVHLVLHSYAGVLAGPWPSAVGERPVVGRLPRCLRHGAGESLLDVEPAEVAERYRRQVADG